MSFIGLAHKDQPLPCGLSPSTETKGDLCGNEDGGNTVGKSLSP